MRGRLSRIVSLWTVGRATQLGLVGVLVALALWPAFAVFQEPLRLPFAASLAFLAFCGSSILLITATDMSRKPKRGRNVRIIRVVDLILGLALCVPAVLVLPDLLR